MSGFNTELCSAHHKQEHALTFKPIADLKVKPDDVKAAGQDVAPPNEIQETIALLEILGLGNHQIDEGKVVPATDAVHIRQNE